jgi:hypothetical protein
LEAGDAPGPQRTCAGGRAQEPSRLAVGSQVPEALRAPGHALTAASPANATAHRDGGKGFAFGAVAGEATRAVE